MSTEINTEKKELVTATVEFSIFQTLRHFLKIESEDQANELYSKLHDGANGDSGQFLVEAIAELSQSNELNRVEKFFAKQAIEQVHQKATNLTPEFVESTVDYCKSFISNPNQSSIDGAAEQGRPDRRGGTGRSPRPGPRRDRHRKGSAQRPHGAGRHPGKPKRYCANVFRVRQRKPVYRGHPGPSGQPAGVSRRTPSPKARFHLPRQPYFHVLARFLR